MKKETFSEVVAIAAAGVIYVGTVIPVSGLLLMGNYVMKGDKLGFMSGAMSGLTAAALSTMAAEKVYQVVLKEMKKIND